MRAFDFAPLLRSSIGFENLNRLVDFADRLDSAEMSYPPYNIEKLGEDDYRISMAVAGFKQNEVDIVLENNVLTITGQAEDRDEDRKFLHRGIAKRAFERRFQLADSIKVTGANLIDGLLNVELKREVPEHKKPRRIEISGNGGEEARPVIESDQEAA